MSFEPEDQWGAGIVIVGGMVALFAVMVIAGLASL